MAIKTVDQVARDNEGVTVGSIRWDLHNRKDNGLEASGAVIRRGRRVLLDDERYLDWMRGNSRG